MQKQIQRRNSDRKKKVNSKPYWIQNKFINFENSKHKIVKSDFLKEVNGKC